MVEKKYVFKEIDLVVGCKDAIRQRMTGDRFTDPIDACATSLYDLEKGKWSEELVEFVGLNINCLPNILSPIAIAGQLRDEQAAQLGLPSGIPIVVGSGDDIEVLGYGLLHSGIVLEHMATTGSILTPIDKPFYDSEMALELYPHVQEGKWILGGSITMAGSALAWVAETLGYSSIDHAIMSVFSNEDSLSEHSIIFIPHLQGERCPNWNPNTRGAWIGLTANTKKQDLMRASLMGVAYGLKSILVRIEKLHGNCKQIRVANKENELLGWLRLRANIYGKSIGIVSNSQPTSLGAMILASVAIGMYHDVEEAINYLVSLKTVIQPDELDVSYNQDGFSKFEQIQKILRTICNEQTKGNV